MEAKAPVSLEDAAPVAPPRVLELEAQQRAFSLNELGLIGQGLAARSPGLADPLLPAGATAAIEGTVAASNAGLPPSAPPLPGASPSPGATLSYSAVPGQTPVVQPRATSVQTLPIIASATINGPADRPTSSQSRSEASDLLDPQDRFDRADPTEASRRWLNESRTNANLVLSEVQGEVQLIAVAPGVDALAQARLQKTVAEVVADHGLTLIDFTLNGSAISGSSVTRLGTQNGNRAR